MRRHKQQLKDLANGQITKVDFENLYEEISRDWQKRAQDLRVRRWRKLHDSTRI